MPFCQAEIILETELKNNITQQKFILNKDHSLEYKKIVIINPKIISQINNWEDYKNDSINFLENAENYDNKYLINDLNKFNQKTQYNFEFDEKRQEK